MHSHPPLPLNISLILLPFSPFPSLSLPRLRHAVTPITRRQIPSFLRLNVRKEREEAELEEGKGNQAFTTSYVQYRVMHKETKTLPKRRQPIEMFGPFGRRLHLCYDRVMVALAIHSRDNESKVNKSFC